MAAVLLVTLFTVLSVWLLNFWQTNRRFYQLAAKIYSVPGGLPLIGHAHKFLGRDIYEIYDVLKTVSSKGPCPRKFWIAHQLVIFLDDPELVQKVLCSKHCIDKPAFYKGLIAENGLLVAGGDLWKKHRKLLNPAFNNNVLKSFMPIFNETSKMFVKELKKHLDGRPFDLINPFRALSLDNILTTSTGLKKDIQTEENNEFLEHCLMALPVLTEKVFKVWLRFKPLYKLTKSYQIEQDHIINGAFKIADKVIQDKENNFRKTPEIEMPTYGSSKSPLIFIDQLYTNRDVLGIQDIHDELITFIVAGFETVSTTMSMLSLLVAMHPEVQEKVFKELQRVFETADEEVTDEHLGKLIYLEQVIKETMRFWAPVPFFARYLSKDVECGSYTLPAGANIAIPVIHIHRDKSIWGEDADEFKPERFEPERFAKIPQYAYLPFSRGPRNCIGYKFAMNAMKVSLTQLFRNYKVTTALKPGDVKFGYVMTISSRNGWMVSVGDRDFKSK